MGTVVTAVVTSALNEVRSSDCGSIKSLFPPMIPAFQSPNTARPIAAIPAAAGRTMRISFLRFAGAAGTGAFAEEEEASSEEEIPSEEEDVPGFKMSSSCASVM